MVWNNNRTNFDRNLAVIIGIDRYENDLIHDLSTPVSDAKAIADLLQTHYGYKEEHVIRLFSPCPDDAIFKDLPQPYPPVTLDNLRTLLTDTLPNRLKPTKSDRLIFYFAGHGLPKNSDKGPSGYLVPQDAELGQENSFLPMSEVYDALEKLQCHHLLVILDCCFAGTFRWASSRKLIAILETIHREHYDRFIRHPAWQVITSSAHDQEALDFVKLSKDRRGDPIQVNNDNHSPFALALLEALQDGEPDEKGRRYQNADYTKDRVITAHELFLYISDRVSKLSKDRQVPGLYPLQREYDKGEFIFVQPGFDPKQLSHAPELNEENNPYRGLKSFEERHANLFFGRQKLVEELSDRLTKSSCPLTVVLGTSGSGKSSLVKAGLIPNLRKKQEQKECVQSWYILAPMRPGASPFTELARVLLPLANSNLITKLAQVSFLDKIFAEILDSKSQQKQKDISQKLISPDNRKQPSEDKFIDSTKLEEHWCKATPEIKLLLIVDYFKQLRVFCSQSQEKKQLSNLYGEIKNSINKLTQTLQHNPESFKNAIAEWSQERPNTKLLLVIDQFEELITMSQDDRDSGKQSDSQEQNKQKEWQRFLSLLRIALAKYRRQLHVIVTLRSDFEPRFLNSDLKVHWRNARFPVRAMNSDELRDAIEGPALKQALYFEPPELVSKLIDEVGQMPGALSLLSFTLSELYIKLTERWKYLKSSDRALRIKDYEELGGVAGALTRRATEEYDNIVREFGEVLGKEYQATIRRVMLRMVAIEGGGVVRRRVPESELVYPYTKENDQVEQVITRLVQARLLVKGQEVGEPYVEPAHDFLVRAWNQLQQWINTDKEDILLQRELTQVSNKWASSKQEKQSKGLLWIDDPRLPQAMKLLCGATYKDGWLNFLKWLSGTYWKSHHFDLSLNADEEEFVKASFDGKNQGFRNFIAITVGIILGLSALLVISQIQRERSVLHEKVASVNNLLSSKPTDALILAIQGIGESQSLFNKTVNSDIIGDLEAALKLAIETPKETNIFRGANNPIQSISINPKGKSVIIGRRSLFGIITDENWKERSALVLWNLQTNNFAQTPSTLTTLFVKSVAFSPNGQYVVLARDAVKGILEDSAIPIALWNIQENSFVKGFRDQKIPVNCVTFSSDGEFIVSGDADNSLSLWDLKGNKRDKLFKAHTDRINSVAASHKYIVSGSDDRTIRLWDFQGKLIWAREHDDAVRSVTFSQNGQYIASSSNDGTVQLWDLQGNLISQPFRGHEGIVYSVAFSPNGHYIISGGADKTVRLWDFQGNLISQPFQGHESAVTSVTFSPDGDNIISGSEDGTVRVWNVHPNSINLPIEGHIDAVLSVAFSPDGKYIASGSKDKTVRLWTLWGIPKGTPFKGHTGAVNTVVFNPKEKSIASGDSDATIWLWNYKGQPVNAPIKPLYSPLPILSLFFSSNGQQLLRFSSNKRWSFYNENLVDCSISWISLQGKILGGSSFSSDSCNALTIRSPFQPSENENLWFSGRSAIEMGSFSSVSRINLKGDIINNRLNRLNSLNGQNFKGHNGDITSLALSPNGEYIVSGGGDTTLRLWTSAGEAMLQSQPFIGHTAKINSLNFSSNGQYIVSGSDDKTIRLWNLEGKLITTFEGHNGSVTSVTFHPSGDYILSSSTDGKMQLWLGSRRIWLQEACNQLQNHGDLLYPQTLIARGARQTCLNFTTREQNTELNKQLSLFHIIYTANFLAKAGDINEAINKFQKAIIIAPDLDFNPRVEAIRIATSNFIEQGRKLARSNKVKEAITKLNTALKFKPDIDLDPKTNLVDTNPQLVVQHLSAIPLLEEGQSLALIGNVKGAVNKFNAALNRDPSLKESSRREDLQLAVLSLIQGGQILVQNNRLLEAFLAYAEALKLDSSFQIPAKAWNKLCWYGSLHGHANEVMNACEKAVALEPHNGLYRDSRGVSRALTGNISGAIDDFQAYMQSTGELVEQYHQRKSWISMLQAGKNPFTPEELNKLLNQ
ncbi:hypothetical protein C7B80_24930 [Cyanosarcina cf. burmensis CCALA 770]|nr:hypothetical protein C7B80_24930 [Cyanosarcina cf. burmensis CCALA 770]